MPPSFRKSSSRRCSDEVMSMKERVTKEKYLWEKKRKIEREKEKKKRERKGREKWRGGKLQMDRERTIEASNCN